MKMTNTLSQHPLLAASTGFAGVGVSTIEMLTPYIQFSVLVGSAILVGLTIVVKFRELKRSWKK